MITFFALLLSLITPLTSADDPWIVYGQTQAICNAGINNPAPNANGIVGEVTSLPYTVPAGKTLIIDAYGLEAYAQTPSGLVLAPYLGATPPGSNSVFLHSVYSDNASNETNGVEFHLRAGMVFNVRLMSAECPSSVVGWYVKGRLVAAAQ